MTRPVELDDGRDLDEMLARHARWVVPAVTLVGAVLAGALQGAGGVILVLAGGALLGVILIFWASLRTLVGQRALSGADAYALAAPRAEEEQKRAVLRALKDLEFERSVGKLTDADYDQLVTKYRAEAKRLLQVLEEDAAPRRERVAALVSRRLRKEGLAEADGKQRAPRPAPPTPEPELGSAGAAGEPDDEARADEAHDQGVAAESIELKITAPPGAEVPPLRRKKEQAESKASGSVCPKCGTNNDDDAVFCKRCGARRGAAREESEADR